MTSLIPPAEQNNSSRTVLAAIRERYPESSFLALGQTVFWDEPVKSVLLQMLAINNLGGKMVIGVHDTDYFAKARVQSAGPRRFALMAHNDGTTRDLWSAAGEISTLFGSETFPSRDSYLRHGVPFRRLARADAAGVQAFLDATTEAWGWRGLVYTGSRNLIVSRLRLSEVGDGIMEMLGWGFENAIAQIAPGCCRDEARAVCERILGWCREFRSQHPDCTLTDLFQHLLPRFYALLLGSEPQNIEVTGTASLLRFAPDTADLPRFRFVDIFLNPGTAEAAKTAYNRALTGAEMYTLDRFGAGALPFDLIVPEHGRGTLRLTPRVLFVETPQPIAIALKKPIESVQELAAVVHTKIANDVALVGKAVSLVSMLAQEFIFVFNEEGSMYVRRTRQMNDALVAQGISLDMRPILRLRYHTWDALSVGSSTLQPAKHIAEAFGRTTITSSDFAARWHDVINEQKALCHELTNLRKPLELMQFLMVRDPERLPKACVEEYQEAKAVLVRLREQASLVQWEIERMYARIQSLKERLVAAQRLMGEHFRSVEDWNAVEIARRTLYEDEISAFIYHKRVLLNEVTALKHQRVAIERGDAALQARAALSYIELEAETARMKLVRNALLTIDGLNHTNHRPSVWWLPMVDSSGNWFRRIAETTDVYTEPLLSPQLATGIASGISARPDASFPSQLDGQPDAESASGHSSAMAAVVSPQPVI